MTVELTLPLQNFSSVVGPNGSGKSNVIDAMLFVFGKRAKQVCCPARLLGMQPLPRQHKLICHRLM